MFKTLRFLYPSNENHHRQQYKRLFPPNIFELFVGAGYFQRDPDAYRAITHAWNAIPLDELNQIKAERLLAINPKQEPTRYIRDYGVYECLGSGAFGSVYRVAPRGSTTMYALKEVCFTRHSSKLWIVICFIYIDQSTFAENRCRS